jgi:hypothetical protein
VGRTLAEAEEVVAICEAAGVPLGVVFQHRMREASQAAHALVQGGSLGALGLAEISVPWWREQAYYDEPGRGTYARDGGGVLISQAIHTIDLALTLTGPVASVQAMTGTSRLHDDGGGGRGRFRPALRQRCAGLAHGLHRELPRKVREHHAAFREGEPAPGRRCAAGPLAGRPTETHGATASTGGGADPMAFTHDWHMSGAGGFRERRGGGAFAFDFRPGRASPPMS